LRDASGGGGYGPARHSHFRSLRDGANRARGCGPRSGSKFRVHPVGRTVLGRTWRDRKERGERAIAGDHRRRNSRPATQAGPRGFGRRDAARGTGPSLFGAAQGGGRQSATAGKSGLVRQRARGRIRKGEERSEAAAGGGGWWT